MTSFAISLPLFLSATVRSPSLGDEPATKILTPGQLGGQEAAQDVALRREVIPKCKTCNWRQFCQGSCTGLTRIKAGSVWATDEFCDLRREIYRSALFQR